MQKFLIVFALALIFSACNSPSEEIGEPDYFVSPDWSLLTAAGKEVTLDEFARSQTTVLFFWATWCPYCKALMPHLQSMQLEYSSQLRILAINVFEDGDPAKFLQDAGYGFTLLMDGEEVAEIYEVSGTPGVLIIDRGRAVRFDLRNLPPINPPDTGKKPNHGRRAAFRAPYWAAKIRTAIDDVLADPGTPQSEGD